jgi:hypothetical protein
MLRDVLLDVRAELIQRLAADLHMPSTQSITYAIWAALCARLLMLGPYCPFSNLLNGLTRVGWCAA